MKKLLALLLLFGIVGCSELLDPPKYKYGDCITPTSETYSWYGEYAKVEAFVIESKGTKNSSYVLNFRTYKSSNNLFMKEIERGTKKVDYLKYCGIPYIQ